MSKCESPIERILLRAMLDYGLIPFLQVKIGWYRVDFAFIEERVVVEADGYRYHSSRRAKRKDKIRDRYLRKNGWTVLHFTGSQIFNDANKCAREIKRRLR